MVNLSHLDLTEIWQRACRASHERHRYCDRGDFHTAAQYGILKARLITHVFRLAPPNDIDISLQWWKSGFCVSITFRRSSLHLPGQYAKLFNLDTRVAQLRPEIKVRSQWRKST